MIKCETYNSPWKLRTLWDQLYAEGNYTPFQSWISNWWYFLTYGLKGSRRKFTPYFLVFTSTENVCIMPVAVDRRRKKVVDFSVGGPVDYYDVLCSTQDKAFLKGCIAKLKTLYEGYEIVLSNINEASRLYSVLSQFEIIETEPCVKIDFSSSEYEIYYQSLSKHQRQNIRTGYNKLQKEGLVWRLERYDTNRPMLTKDWNQCLCMYEERCRMKNKSGSGFKQRIVDWKNRHINLVNILIRRWDRVASFVMYLNDVPVAFMSGMYNESHDTFYVPRLSCNNQYLRYDTGILMLNESIKILLTDGISTVDLTRGDEMYKFAMGGGKHVNYTIRIGII